MELYDKLINETNALLNSFPQRSWDYNANNTWIQTPNSEIVLQRDTAYELGETNLDSIFYTCVTSGETAIAKDETVLIGKDLCELTENTPYGRIALIETENISDDNEAYKLIKDLEFVKYNLFPKGFMLRSSSISVREQVRVSKAALADGISFEKIGNAYIKKLKENPSVKKVKQIFITDAAVNFKKLKDNAYKIDEITKALNHIMDGLDLDCHACSMKPICDEVEGMKELHIKKLKIQKT